MHRLLTAELLHLWECGSTSSSATRSIEMLAAHHQRSMDELVTLPVGRREALLLDLRESSFGEDVSCVISCPSCAEQVEWDFRLADIRVKADNSQTNSRVEYLGHEVEFRLPNTRDLWAIATAKDLADARAQLLERCLTSALVPLEQIPDEVIDAVSDSMAALDPQADIQFELDCPKCARSWLSPFDIGSFFWEELQTWARRILQEVHTLATAYGWSERDVLAMSVNRRQFYLRLVQE